MRRNLVLALIIFSGCASGSMTKSTVKVTNLASNSGGSGTIVSASETESLILTNAHVCGVVKNGGLIHTSDSKTHFVVSYRISQIHDLCLISTSANLGSYSSVSSSAPAKFDESIVAGHPRLLPTILTKGYFSDKLVIRIMAGVRECTEAEKLDQNTAPFCSIFGVVPIIKTYETIVVSSLIQPGSSGSGIYSNGKISAVIFAGSGDLGFGLAVPHEFVYNFLENEVKFLPSQYPNNELSLTSEEPRRDRQFIKKVQSYCEADNYNKTPEAEKICTLFQEINKYDNLLEYPDNQ